MLVRVMRVCNEIADALQRVSSLMAQMNYEDLCRQKWTLRYEHRYKYKQQDQKKGRRKWYRWIIDGADDARDQEDGRDDDVVQSRVQLRIGEEVVVEARELIGERVEDVVDRRDAMQVRLVLCDDLSGENGRRGSTTDLQHLGDHVDDGVAAQGRGPGRVKRMARYQKKKEFYLLAASSTVRLSSSPRRKFLKSSTIRPFVCGYLRTP